MSEKDTIKLMLDFNPFRVTMLLVERFVGRVDIIFPESHVKLADLSVGGILPGIHVGANARLFALHMDIEEPGMEAGDMLKFLLASKENLETLHQAVQQELDKTFLT